MDLCSESCLFGGPAGGLSCMAKTFNIGHYRQTVQPNFVIPAILVGTIDFYHGIPLLLTLTLPGGHKDSAKQDILASFSRTLLLIRMKFDVVMKQFKLNTLRLFLSDIL